MQYIFARREKYGEFHQLVQELGDRELFYKCAFTENFEFIYIKDIERK